MFVNAGANFACVGCAFDGNSATRGGAVFTNAGGVTALGDATFKNTANPCFGGPKCKGAPFSGATAAVAEAAAARGLVLAITTLLQLGAVVADAF